MICFGLFLGAALSECLIDIALRTPFLYQTFPRLKTFIRDVYADSDRMIIQYEPACTKYDSGLGYTLRPGECSFVNREFETKVTVNRMGLRDDEASLIAPDVIVLGDSFAMGWGVEAEETFAKIIQRETGLKVLNAAIPSYDTVRELRLLKRLDTSHLKYLIIQYCGNDYADGNKVFADTLKFKPVAKTAYDREVRHYLRRQRIPGQHLLRYIHRLTLLWRRKHGFVSQDASLWPTPQQEAEVFLKVLKYGGPAHLGKVRLIMIALPPEPEFTQYVKNHVVDDSYPHWARKMDALDLSPFLSPGDYFTLDGHLNRHGHKSVADALLKAMHAP